MSDWKAKAKDLGDGDLVWDSDEWREVKKVTVKEPKVLVEFTDADGFAYYGRMDSELLVMKHGMWPENGYWYI